MLEYRWGKSWLKPKYRDSGYLPWYFIAFFMNRKMREAIREAGMPTVGLVKFWYDYPHAQLNLYFFGFGWSTPYTTMPEEDE